MTLESAVLVAYFSCLVVLSVYGAHRFHIIRLYLRHRSDEPTPAREFESLPVVTVQLPVYNEVYVVDRLIRSVAALRDPREKLEIQVLDDSTDESRQMARAKVQHLRLHSPALPEGTRDDWNGPLDIVYIHRVDRTGYKAGALDAGLTGAKGELVAIFDADFIPQGDSLTTLVGHFLGEANAKTGMVQARWGHMNREMSLLTKVQARMLEWMPTAGRGLPRLFTLDRRLAMPCGFAYRIVKGQVAFSNMNRAGRPEGDVFYPHTLAPVDLLMAGLITYRAFDKYVQRASTGGSASASLH